MTWIRQNDRSSTTVRAVLKALPSSVNLRLPLCCKLRGSKTIQRMTTESQVWIRLGVDLRTKVPGLSAEGWKRPFLIPRPGLHTRRMTWVENYYLDTMQMLTYWGVENILSLRLEYMSVTVVTKVHLKEKQSRKEEALRSLLPGSLGCTPSQRLQQ